MCAWNYEIQYLGFTILSQPPPKKKKPEQKKPHNYFNLLIFEAFYNYLSMHLSLIINLLIILHTFWPAHHYTWLLTIQSGMFRLNMSPFVSNAIRCENEPLVYNKIVLLASTAIYKKTNACDASCSYVTIADTLRSETLSGLYNFYLSFKMTSVLSGKKIIIYKRSIFAWGLYFCGYFSFFRNIIIQKKC